MPRITDFDAAGTLAGGEHIHLAQPSSTVTITATTISAQASDNSFNDSGSGFAFAVGDRVVVSGFTNTENNLDIGVITSATASKIIIGGTDGDVIVDEAAGASVTIAKLVSRRATAQEIADLGGGGGGGGETTYTDTLTLSGVGSATWAIPANCIRLEISGVRIAMSGTVGNPNIRLRKASDGADASFARHQVAGTGFTESSTASDVLIAVIASGTAGNMTFHSVFNFPRSSTVKTTAKTTLIAPGSERWRETLAVAVTAEDHDEFYITAASSMTGDIQITYVTT